MKKTIITLLALFLSISFCISQSNVRQQKEVQEQNIQRQKEIQDNKVKAELARKEKEEAERKKREEQLRKDTDQRYQNAIASAQRNFDQRQYSQAWQDYQLAFEIKPEKAASFDARMAELDRLILEKAIEDAAIEQERLYQEALTSAQINIMERQYAQAKQNYLTALTLKPENADFINAKIAEINKPAQINFYRKGSFLELLQDNYDVFLDNIVIGRTKSKWKTSVTVNDIGTKIISATNDGRQTELRIDVEPAGIYYVRCSVNSYTVKTGEWKTRTKKDGTKERYEETRLVYEPKIELMEPTLGERDFNSIKVK